MGVKHNLYLVILMSFLTFLPINAEAKSYTGYGTHIMNDNEYIKHAQDEATKFALVDVTNQIGAYIESNSIAKNDIIVNDIINMYTSSRMVVREKNFKKELTSDGKIQINVKLTVEIDENETAKLLDEITKMRKTSKEHQKAIEDYNEEHKKYKVVNERYKQITSNIAEKKVYEGIQMEKEGKFEEAVRCYQEAIIINDSLPRAYSRLGHHYRRNGEFSKALQQYEKALSIDINDSGAHYGKGLIYEINSKNELAVEEYRKFIKFAGIVEYKKEILEILNRMVSLTNIP